MYFWLGIGLAKAAAGFLAWLFTLWDIEREWAVLPPAIHVALMAAFAGTGIALVAGSRPGPARSLGVVFCLFSSIFADPLVERLTPADMGAWLRRPVLALVPVALAPAYFWRFAWEFPRFQPALLPAWAPGLFERVTFAAGGAMFCAAALFSLGDVRNGLSGVSWQDLIWTGIVLLALPTVALLVAKARTALPDERRRVTLFISGLVLGMAPLHVDILLSAVLPPYREFFQAPARTRVVAGILAAATLLIPAVTAYAVVVDRVLETRYMVRLAIQYALARYTVLGLALVPVAFLARHLYIHRLEPLVDILTRAPLPVWLALLGLTLYLSRVRRSLLHAIDRRYFREQHDARSVLASLTDSTRRVASLEQLARLVASEIDNALHVDKVALLVRNENAFEDPLGATPSLAADGTLATLAGGSSSAFDLEATTSQSPLRRLPMQDIEWIDSADATVLLPLIDSGGSLLGLLVLGGKRSEAKYSSEDRLLLQAVASAVLLTLEQRLHQRTPLPFGQGAALDVADSEPAQQCDRCERIFKSTLTTCEGCLIALRPASVPSLLAGKFRVLSRIGSGGMGIVYMGEDVDLNRPVAIKTLPRLSEAAVRRLRREARALATIHHPNLEGIYGVESWRGTPMLVLEYLSGGTLASRLRGGPLEVQTVIETGAAMADALHSLHRAGVLHRDIKPSNIGFTGDDTPKLLDFGLAVVAAPDFAKPSGDLSEHGESITRTRAMFASAPDQSSGILAGTPLYMSPEAIAGGKPDVGFDLWGLAVTLFEATAGMNPFVAGDRLETARLISHGILPDIRSLRADCPVRFATFLHDSLSVNRLQRPRSAREFGSRLRAADVRVGA